ncbi:hypothetical protein Tco_0534892 [Tanacetum coccineum]
MGGLLCQKIDSPSLGLAVTIGMLTVLTRDLAAPDLSNQKFSVSCSKILPEELQLLLASLFLTLKYLQDILKDLFFLSWTPLLISVCQADEFVEE